MMKTDEGNQMPSAPRLAYGFFVDPPHKHKITTQGCRNRPCIGPGHLALVDAPWTTDRKDWGLSALREAAWEARYHSQGLATAEPDTAGALVRDHARPNRRAWRTGL